MQTLTFLTQDLDDIQQRAERRTSQSRQALHVSLVSASELPRPELA